MWASSSIADIEEHDDESYMVDHRDESSNGEDCEDEVTDVSRWFITGGWKILNCGKFLVDSTSPIIVQGGGCTSEAEEFTREIFLYETSLFHL